MKYLNSQLGGAGSIKYTSLRGSLFNQIEIENLDVNIPDQIQVKCNYLEVHYDLWKLLYNEIKVSKILIDQLEVEIISEPEKKSESDEDKKHISVDTTLIKIEESNFVDNLLDRLPVIQISDINITATSVRLINQDLQFTDIDLMIDRAAINKKNYAVKLDQLKGNWKDREVGLLNASFELEGDRNQVTLNRFEVETEKSKFGCSAYYNLKGASNAELEIYTLYADMDEIARITQIDTLRNGYIEGECDFSGEITNFTLTLNLKGQWQDRILNNLTSTVQYNEGLIKLDQLSVRSNAGQIDVSGQGRENQDASGKIKFSNVNLNKIMPNLVSTDLNGLFDFDFEALHFTRPTGAGSLTLIVYVLP